MFNAEQIHQRIEYELKSKGISGRKMLLESGLSKNIMDNMKNGSMPSADKIAKISEYLGVSIDFIMGMTASPQTIPETNSAPDDEVRSAIVSKVKQLSDSQALRLLAFLEGMLAG